MNLSCSLSGAAQLLHLPCIITNGGLSFPTSLLFRLVVYQWGRRDCPNPGKSPYYSEEFFSVIRDVKKEGLLRLSGMSLRDWYKVLIEKYIFKSGSEENLSKCELRSPEVDWSQTWSLVMHKCLDSDDQSFLLRLLHGLLPSQEKLARF